MKFAKMHGIGNDFIVLDESGEELFGNDSERGEFAKKYCNRRFSVGADGSLSILPSKNADFFMKIINSDGSIAETCVNGLRCVAFYWFLKKGNEKKMKIETLAGIVEAEILNADSNKGMVKIIFEKDVTVKNKGKLDIAGKTFDYAEIDFGNPHAVIFLEEPVDGFPVEEIGHKISYHKNFPNGTNTEFVNLISDTKIKMRVHERGACETQACGSGSIAIVKAGVERGVLKKDSLVEVEQPGGTLKIKLGDKIELEGEAELAFEGELNVV